MEFYCSACGEPTEPVDFNLQVNFVTGRHTYEPIWASRCCGAQLSTSNNEPNELDTDPDAMSTVRNTDTKGRKQQRKLSTHSVKAW